MYHLSGTSFRANTLFFSRTAGAVMAQIWPWRLKCAKIWGGTSSVKNLSQTTNVLGCTSVPCSSSDTSDICLTENHSENYSPNLGMGSQILVSGSWTNNKYTFVQQPANMHGRAGFLKSCNDNVENVSAV